MTRAERRLGLVLAGLAALGLAGAALIAVAPGSRARAMAPRCDPAPGNVALVLPRSRARLATGHSLTVVALGSSSTEGIGASGPEDSYPSRLAAILQAEFPRASIRVLNRGVGGETAAEMAARIDRDVLPARPDLVIWQLGTNAVLRELDLSAQIAAARRGIARLKSAGSEIVLMDLQYAPAVLQHPGYRAMLHLLAGLARGEDVPLFRRFALMRHWVQDGEMSVGLMLAADGLHMSDASYDCLARQVARSLLGGPPTS